MIYYLFLIAIFSLLVYTMMTHDSFVNYNKKDTLQFDTKVKNLKDQIKSLREYYENLGK
jgi:hypothetical protein